VDEFRFRVSQKQQSGYALQDFMPNLRYANIWTPANLGCAMPAEWEKHEATWLAWPHNETDWPGKMDAIRWAYAEMARKISPGEIVRILVRHKAEQQIAANYLKHAGCDLKNVRFILHPTNRSWMRDSGPIFVRKAESGKRKAETAIVHFHFNAWAKHDDWQKDRKVPEMVARVLGKQLFHAECGVGASTQNSKLKTQNFPSHQIHEYLYLSAALGANPEPLPPQLFVSPDEIEAAKKKFGLNEIGRPIFGLNPGAEYGPAKRWPVEKFVAAAREIQQRTNCVWLLFGGNADALVANQIESETQNSKFKIQNLTGQTSLRELMALLKLCRVLLTNDSGPMHVAAALGTPVVVPFGSTSPELTGPGLPGDTRHRLLKSDAPCSPCFLRECPIDFRCMNGISIERVVKAVLETTK
jgi:lipopolysaccharide heptosyltransferase II